MRGTWMKEWWEICGEGKLGRGGDGLIYSALMLRKSGTKDGRGHAISSWRSFPAG